MRDERVEVDGIPARLHVPAGAGGLLLLGHGGARSKDSPRFVDLSRRHAAGTGLAVVCIDAVDHGERAPPGGGQGIPPGWHSQAIAPMVADWARTAEALAAIGPAVAYVGFSMGAVFGLPVVASLPALRAAVLVVGGIPSGGGIDDPALGPTLLRTAAQLGEVPVLMLGTTDDEVFPAEGTQAVFDAIPGGRKRLSFHPGGHDDWSDALVEESIAFVAEHATPP